MNDLVIVTFDELAEARAGFFELERLATKGHVTVRAGALVVRDADGRFRIPDGDQAGATNGSSENALLELVRMLAAPVGLLSRLASFALAASMAEGHGAEVPEGIVCTLARRLLPGTTALVADIDAPIPGVVDTALESSGGSVTRRLRVDFEAELAATRKVLDEPPQTPPSTVAHAPTPAVVQWR